MAEDKHENNDKIIYVMATGAAEAKGLDPSMVEEVKT